MNYLQPQRSATAKNYLKLFIVTGKSSFLRRLVELTVSDSVSKAVKALDLSLSHLLYPS
jgi:hypothetical protein